MSMLSRPLSIVVVTSVCLGLSLGCGESGGQAPGWQPPTSTLDGATALAGDTGTSAPAPGADAGTLGSGSRADASTEDAASPSSSMDAGDSGALVGGGEAGSGPAEAGAPSEAGPPADAGDGDGGPAAPACTGTPLSVGDHEYSIQSKNGQKYSYILSVPKTVDPTQRAPLIVHWHALSSDPEEARKVTSIDAKGEAAKALLVFPRSPDKSWDVGTCCTTTVGGTRRDEEVFARELVKDVVAKACVDEKRIYTNGFSNGGMISQLLACKMADVFAASAPMGSTLTSPAAECKPSRPVPIFLLNGTADPLVGYNASGTSGGLSVVDDVKFWVEKNGCKGTPETFLTKGKVSCTRYTQCSAGAEVAACAITGMGHCVPGMKTESASNCLTKIAFGLIPIQLGMPNNDVDGLQMDVDFLLRFTLP
jgi:polyhydroxybutyrate depolymerase